MVPSCKYDKREATVSLDLLDAFWGLDGELNNQSYDKSHSCLIESLDLEAITGKVEDIEIIEFGAVRVVNGIIVDEFSSLANPGKHIPHGITQLTGISDETVADAPPVSEVIKAFAEFLGDNVMVGHQIGSSDSAWLFHSSCRHLEKPICNEWIDTHTLASRAKLKESNNLPNLEQHTLLDFYDIKNDHEHRAIHDARANQQLYEKLKSFIFNGEVVPPSAAFGGYTRQHIIDTIQRVTDDYDNVVLKETSYSASIYMFGRVAFRITLTTNRKTLDTECPVAADYLDRIPGMKFKGKTYHIPIASTESVTDHIYNLVCDIYEFRRDGAPKGIPFACCNDYLLCSNARECIHKDNPDLRGCYYRKNLENGKILYGENKNWPPEKSTPPAV